MIHVILLLLGSMPTLYPGRDCPALILRVLVSGRVDEQEHNDRQNNQRGFVHDCKMLKGCHPPHPFPRLCPRMYAASNRNSLSSKMSEGIRTSSPAQKAVISAMPMASFVKLS